MILAVAVFVFSSVLTAQAQTGTSIWRDEMDYQSVDQLEAEGWTITHQAGVSFGGSGIILDGTSTDTAIHYSNHFSSGITNWRVEDRSRWTLGSHCGNSVTAITNKHSYTFMADGWYGNYVFYRDGQKTTFGSYQETMSEWFTLSIEKQGNQINMYYNGELKSTYTETDSSPSQLTGVDAVSPWRGGSEYDYFEVWQIGDTSTQEAQQSLLSNPIVVGGIIGAVGVGVGGVLYFFVFSGSGSAGSAAGSAGASAGSVAGGAGGVGGTGQGGHGSSGSSSQPEQPYSEDSPYSSGQADLQQNQYDNSQNNNYDTQQPEENPYSSGQSDLQQNQYDNSQNDNYDTQHPEDSPYSSGQSDPQQNQYDNSQNSNYGTQQPEENPYSSGQNDPQQNQYDNSQNNNYESSRGTSENTKNNKKSSAKTE
jgi:hypothetical protein